MSGIDKAPDKKNNLDDVKTRLMIEQSIENNKVKNDLGIDIIISSSNISTQMSEMESSKTSNMRYDILNKMHSRRKRNRDIKL